MGLLNKQRQVVRQLGRLVDGFELDALHVKQGAGVGPGVPGHDAEVRLFQVCLRDDDVLDGLRAHKVAQAARVVKVQVGDDEEVNVLRLQTLLGQRLLDGDALGHGVVVQHLLAVQLGKVFAVAGVIEDVAQGGVLDEQRHRR